jgi:putative ABC transport system permease protein
VRLHRGHREHRLAIQGLIDDPQLHRLLNAQLQPVALPVQGLLVTDYLADLLGVGPGDWLDVEVLEGQRPELRMPVAAVVAENIGLNAYMRLDQLNRVLREGEVINAVYLQVDEAERAALFRQLKDMPRVAGVSLQSEAVRSFREDMAETMLAFTLIITLLAVIIAVGVVYNSARIALAERARELASLRIIGFRRAEVSYILLGELALLTVLALPPGFVLGRGVIELIASRLGSELFRVPAVVAPSTYAMAASVVLAAAVVSGLLVWRRLQRMDIIEVLKTRE